MSYIYVAALIAIGGLIWLIFKSRELTAASLKLRKDQKTARGRFVRGANEAPTAALQRDTQKRPKFGQR